MKGGEKELIRQNYGAHVQDSGIHPFGIWHDRLLSQSLFSRSPVSAWMKVLARDVNDRYFAALPIKPEG